MTDKKGLSLDWYYYVMLAVVALVALSMTWWSMYDLAVQELSVPNLLAAGVSLIFDIGGIYLAGLSIRYAQTDDSGFWTELGAYLFIATSTYLVAQHAILEGYPHAGIVMFAAAPIILGIILKATLHYLTRQQRRQAGRVTERLPSVGWLTWLRYAPQAWRLSSVAMQGRIINAADKLEIAPDRHGIFDKAQTVKTTAVLGAETIVENTTDTVLTTDETTDNSPQQLSQPVVLPELTSPDHPTLPVWLPHEPTMSLGKLVRTALDNGVNDIETIYRFAIELKGQDVNKTSLSRTLSREKTKLQ